MGLPTGIILLFLNNRNNTIHAQLQDVLPAHGMGQIMRLGMRLLTAYAYPLESIENGAAALTLKIPFNCTAGFTAAT